MGNIIMDFVTSSIVLALLGSCTRANPCSYINHTVAGSVQERCDETTTGISKSFGQGSDSNDSGIASHTVYTIVVVFGVVLIPIIVLTRVCWLRKLQRQRCEVINEMRQIVDERVVEVQRRASGVFSLDLLNLPLEEMLGKPPSYEESIANPSSGSPPPYDEPPGYKNRQFEFDENPIEFSGVNDTQQNPSLNASCSGVTEIDPQQGSSLNNSCGLVANINLQQGTNTFDCSFGVTESYPQQDTRSSVSNAFVTETCAQQGGSSSDSYDSVTENYHQQAIRSSDSRDNVTESCPRTGIMSNNSFDCIKENCPKQGIISDDSSGSVTEMEAQQGISLIDSFESVTEIEPVPSTSSNYFNNCLILDDEVTSTRSYKF